jgi:MFS superfamily sulfate permease-like transporter
VLLAGLMQLVAGLLKGGRWFRAVPPSVIHGMLGGIGVLIFASQFHVMIDDEPRGNGLQCSGSASRRRSSRPCPAR